MHPPDYLIAYALEQGALALGATEERFRSCFVGWPEAEVDDLWAAWSNENTRPKVRLSRPREAAQLPQWTVHLRGSQPAAQYAHGGRDIDDGVEWWRWLEEFGIEVETVAANPRMTKAWWWFGKCAVQTMHDRIVGGSTCVGYRHGNTVPMSDDVLVELKVELGHSLSAWWHVSMDCYCPVLPQDEGPVESVLIIPTGYYDDDGNEGGMPA